MHTAEFQNLCGKNNDCAYRPTAFFFMYWSTVDFLTFGPPSWLSSKESTCDACQCRRCGWLRWQRICLQCGRPGLIPGSGRFPGEGNDYPFQYSCLENLMDRGAWGATVYGVSTNRWGNSGNSGRLYFWGSKITADGDCSREIKRCLLLGRKAITNLDSTLKSRDIP